LAVVRDGDVIAIDAEKFSLELVDVTTLEIRERLKSWKLPRPLVTRGVLAEYAHLVGDVSHGAMTDFVLEHPKQFTKVGYEHCYRVKAPIRKQSK
jgi:dihydroxyacid dehydratase/phosphogluconate dehydratase